MDVADANCKVGLIRFTSLEYLKCLFGILGVTVKTNPNSKKKIRVFPLVPTNQEQPCLRTNETYDAFMDVYQNQHSVNSNELRDRFRGHISPCILRNLKYFDVGTSFLSDSLHNIYHGVMVSSINNYFSEEIKIDDVLSEKYCSYL